MSKKRNELVAGILLIVIGLLVFAQNIFELPALETLGIYFVLALGLFFLAWGIITREGGLIIPGGILSGIGLGIVLVAGGTGFGDELQSGGVFMGAFALGWLLITILTAVFTSETQWWPLIPAAIMALISGALLIEGPFMFALEWLGKLWPLALIAGGIAIILGARKMSGKEDKSAEASEIDEAPVEKLQS